MLNFSYCEHTAFYFTSQPLNVFSSAAFFFVAYLLFRMTPPSHPRFKRTGLLIILTMFIGAGSMLWHSMEELWALIADIIPIFLFLFMFQYAFLRKFTDWRTERIMRDMIMLASMMGVASLLWDDIFLQKSNAFVPLCFWLLYIGVIIGQRFPRQARLCFVASMIFALAIVARIMDMPLCELWPYGTHFLWHALSALTVYTVMLGFKPVVRRSP